MTIIGIAFPFTRSPSSLPASSTDDDSIEDNIRRILLTPRGSRVMRPSVGSNMYRFVFQNTGIVLRNQIDLEVRRAIAAGEPRAVVLRTETEEDNTPTGRRVLVTITYEVNSEVKSTSVTF
jgi:phage baseplate assembly protein W